MPDSDGFQTYRYGKKQQQLKCSLMNKELDRIQTCKVQLPYSDGF